MTTSRNYKGMYPSELSPEVRLEMYDEIIAVFEKHFPKSKYITDQWMQKVRNHLDLTEEDLVWSGRKI